jgi:hypothetical protein
VGLSVGNFEGLLLGSLLGVMVLIVGHTVVFFEGNLVGIDVEVIVDCSEKSKR